MQQYHWNKRGRRNTKHTKFLNENTNSHGFGVGDNATQLLGQTLAFFSVFYLCYALKLVAAPAHLRKQKN